MTKSKFFFIVTALVLIGVGFWLFQSTNPKHLNQTTQIIDVPDTFEK